MTNTTSALVLVVDDDETLRLLTRTVLEQAGFLVAEAPEANNLVDMLHRLRPDLILLDVMMPGIDGFSACARLRTDPLGAHIPILMMTGLDDIESIDKAYESGATDFVTKPINFGLLNHRLRYMLRAKATADELRASEARLALAQRIARLGQWEADARGRFVPLTTETYDVLFVPRTEKIADFDDLANLVVAEDRHRVADVFATAVRDGASFNLEFRIAVSDGQSRNLHLVGVVDGLADGNQRFIGTLQDISERRRAEEQIHQLAFFDTITGLPNRAALRSSLLQTLALRNGRPLATLSIDIDYFQRVNDMLGFASGNELLRAVGERFRGILRARESFAELSNVIVQDTIGRAAGDEFIVILSEIASAEDAAAVARRFRGALTEPFAVGEQEIYVRASIGISVYPEDGTNADDLLKQADSAVAQAKREGRDCYRFYTATLNARARHRLTIEMQLQRALEREQFMVYFQPKLRCADLALVGFEALARWQSPELGRISPAEFIPIAEETGLIIPIGEWILEHACRQLLAWDRAGMAPLTCAVNLSAAQFRVRELHNRLAEVVAATGLDAGRIEMELTESVLMEDGQAAIRTLHALKSHGFGIAVDDFGTGYSSLSYLKRLPIDVLKIDQTFVRDLAIHEDDAAIVSTIISMARSLRLKVVAEGVEQEAQFALLLGQGCDEVQGHLFSPALAAHEIEDWMNRRSQIAKAG